MKLYKILMWIYALFGVLGSFYIAYADIERNIKVAAVSVIFLLFIAIFSFYKGGIKRKNLAETKSRPQEIATI